jgi:hypothetical protein
MKYAPLFLLALLVAGGAKGQNSSLEDSSVETAADTPEIARNFDSVVLLPTENFPAPPEASPAAESGSAFPQGGVTSVFAPTHYQVYGGYTFVRFYAFPGRVGNRNGVDLSMSYFFWRDIVGVEGAVTGVFGSIGNVRSDFAFVGGGPRVRWLIARGLEVWAHALLGDGHFGPQVANFSQDGLAYELGAGVDISSRLRRLSYRVEGDMIGSRLYDTTQYSPKVSAGVVFKF